MVPDEYGFWSAGPLSMRLLGFSCRVGKGVQNWALLAPNCQAILQYHWMHFSKVMDFDPKKTIPFTQSSTNDEADDGKRNKRKGGVDEIDEDSDVFNTGVFNPYEILDLSPMDEIGEDELRAAFQKASQDLPPRCTKNRRCGEVPNDQKGSRRACIFGNDWWMAR